MQERILRKRVTKQEFYNSYLKSFNGYLNLTGRELEVLVELCNYQAQNSKLEYNQQQISNIVFGSTSRKIIRGKLGISPYNLNNILKVLRAKGIILINPDKSYSLNPRLFIPLTDTEYSVQYKFELI